MLTVVFSLGVQHGSALKIGQRFRAGSSNTIISTSPASLQFQKPPKLPQYNMYSSQDKTHSITNSKSPKTSCRSCYTTIPEVLDTLILSLMLIPIETRATILDHFLTFLTHRKFFRQDFSNPILLIKFCFYLFTTPQNQNLTTLFCLPKSLAT